MDYLNGLLKFDGILAKPSEVVNIYKVKYKKLGGKNSKSAKVNIYVCPHCRHPFILTEKMAVESCPNCKNSLEMIDNKNIYGINIKNIVLPKALSQVPKEYVNQALAIFLYGYKAYRMATIFSSFHLRKFSELPKFMQDRLSSKIDFYCEDVIVPETVEDALFEWLRTEETNLKEMLKWLKHKVGVEYTDELVSYSLYTDERSSSSAGYVHINLEDFKKAGKIYKVSYKYPSECKSYFRLLVVGDREISSEEDIAIYNSKTANMMCMRQDFAIDQKVADCCLHLIKF